MGWRGKLERARKEAGGQSVRVGTVGVVLLVLILAQRGSAAQVGSEPSLALVTEDVFLPIVVNEMNSPSIPTPTPRPTPAPVPSSSLLIIEVVVDEFYPDWCKAYGTIWPPDGVNDGVVTWLDIFGPACSEVEVGAVCYCPVMVPPGYCTEVTCEFPDDGGGAEWATGKRG